MNNKANAYINILYNLIDDTLSTLIENEMAKYESDIDYKYVDELISVLDATDKYVVKIKELI